MKPPAPRAFENVEDVVTATADRAGAWLWRSFPLEKDNRTLLSLARALGTPVPDRRMPAHAMEGPFVYRVALDPLNTDEHAYSATAGHFALHTDGAHWKQPAAYVLLLCWENTAHGGDTTLVHVDDVVAALSASQRHVLREEPVSWDDVDAPVFWGDGQLRYNRATISRRRNSGAWQPGPALEEALDALDAVLARLETQPALHLAKGDLLLLDNTRVLHGRTAFVPDGVTRLLKRVRVDATRSAARSCAPDAQPRELRHG